MYAPIMDRNALRSAVYDQNPQRLRIIVDSIRNTNPQKLKATFNGNTALNLLIKNRKNNNENFNQCLNILLEADIDVNKPDKKQITPILWACEKRYKDAVQAILESGKYVDIDNQAYRGKTARNYIITYHLYDGDLNEQIAFDSNENTRLPDWYIQNNKETEFLELTGIDYNGTFEEGTLLQLACRQNMLKAVERLVERGADVNKTTDTNTEVPLKIAAENGHHRIFSILLPKYNELPKDILTRLLIKLPLYQDENTNYQECLNILLDSDKPLSVHEYSDTGNTPLHYASLITDPKIILKLLGKGANLANENRYGFIPVEEIDPEILKEHFDNAVTVKEFNSEKQTITVNFDYSSILPTTSIEQEANKDEEAGLLGRKPLSETGVIRVISETPEMHHLLVHPLIASFISIKWHRMRWFFWINLIFFLIFAFTFFMYIFIPTSESIQNDYKILRGILWTVLLISYILLICRELFQLILSVRTYCCSYSNILEVAMIVVCFYPIFSSNIMHKGLSSMAMVFIAIELMVLGAQHPHLSTYMVMLRTVTKNFFHFLGWYAVLIFAFAMCFYNLFNTNSNTTITNNSETENDTACEDEKQNFFNEVGLTFIKTIVMLTGEFDASSINFNNFWNQIIFLLFVFMIPIILFNLLNGLAVSDTQQIKSEAEIVGYIERVNYIVYLENIILGNTVTRNDWLLQNCFTCSGLKLTPNFLIEKISLVPQYLADKIKEIKLRHDGLIIENENEPNGCFNFCRVRVDRKTVKRVKHLSHKRKVQSNKDQKANSLEDVINALRQLIDQQRTEINTLRAEVQRYEMERRT